ncbi:MAG: chemotaxis protein CheW [bacterium]
MLVVLFDIDGQKFGIDSQYIKEVIPYVQSNPVLYAPPYIIGEIIYQEEAIPLIDLNMLFSGNPADEYFSSRIAILRLLHEPQGLKIALLANKMTKTVNCEDNEFVHNNLGSYEDSLFINVFRKDGLRIQMTEVEKLLHKKDYIELLNKIYENKPVA